MKRKKIWIGIVAVIIVLDLAWIIAESAVEETPPPAVAQYCTVAVRCDEALTVLDQLPEEKQQLLPADGSMYYAAEFAFTAGETALDVLVRALQAENMQLDFSAQPTAYVKGIGNLYELELGPMSGWKYEVNGAAQEQGCAEYVVQEGDLLAWDYCLDFSAYFEW